MKINVYEIERKLEALREEWKYATHEKREILRRQARALELARDKINKRDSYIQPVDKK